jgi:TolA-binding protein
VITVKGTVFDVTWEPSLERFELGLREGRVTVEGPVSGGTLALHQGQRLVVNLSRSETIITDGQFERGAVGSVDAPDAGTTLPALPGAANPLPASASPVPGKAPSSTAAVTETRSWAQALASGHWDHILAEVKRVGVETALNRASSEDLFALSDAARYRRQVDLARDALVTQRRRFPNSPRATDALFLLGRVEESRGGASARALAWYDEYLRRAPSGGFAAEALGRKMIISNKTQPTAQTRSLAEAYLRQFPKGSYAGTARAILRAP